MCWLLGGPVVKNLLANAGDMGSTPGLRRSHVLRGNYTRVLQLLSPRATPEPECPRACALQQGRPLQGQALTPAQRN